MILFLILIASAFFQSGCGGSSIPTPPIEVPAPIAVNFLDGGEGVPVDTVFKFTFSRPVNIGTVNKNTFFIVEAAPANASVSSKAVFDFQACDSSRALDAVVTCSSSTECSLIPTENLKYSTEYRICLTPAILYTNGDPFEGFVAVFTTEEEGPLDLNNLDGTAGVPVDSSFRYRFQKPVVSDTVDSSTYFIVSIPAAPSLSFLKAEVDMGLCDPANSLDADIECTDWSCTLYPLNPLEFFVSHAVCLMPAISYELESATVGGQLEFEARDTFEGFMASFTTERSGLPPEPEPEPEPEPPPIPKSYEVSFNIADGAEEIDPREVVVLTLSDPADPFTIDDDTFFIVEVPDDYGGVDGFDPSLCVVPEEPWAQIDQLSEGEFSLTPIDRLDHLKRYAACAVGCDVLPEGITFANGDCMESSMVLFTTRDWRWIEHNEGMFGFQVAGLAIDFNDPDTVYVLTSANGVYKSTDGGATWVPKNNGFPENPSVQWAHMVGNLLTIDPNDPAVLYTNMVGRVYKTVDGGDNWVDINDGDTPEYSIEVCAPNYQIAGVAVDPQNSDHLMAGHIAAGCSGGIFESFDAGANWVQIAGSGSEFDFLGNDAWTVAIDPTDDQRIYSASVYQTFQYSTDGGTNWEKVVPPGADTHSANVVVHPTYTNRIFLSNYNGLFVSDNYGLDGSWTDMSVTVSGLDSHIGFAPSNTERGYIASDSGLYRSNDGGLSWSYIGYAGMALRSLAIHPTDSDIIYVGSTGRGLYKSVNGGENLVTVNEGLPSIIVLRDLVVSESAYFASVNGHGVLRTFDRGRTWENVFSAQFATDLEIDPSNENIIYAGAGGPMNLIKSTDGGDTWTAILDEYIPDVKVFPDNSQEIWAMIAPNIYRSYDGGSTWDPPDAPAEFNINIYGIEIDPSNPDFVYAFGNNKLLKSEDRGENWTSIMHDYTCSGCKSVYKLIINPHDPQTLYITTWGNKDFKSEDGGGSWSEIANLPSGYCAYSMIVDAYNAETIYGVDCLDVPGWYRSTDGGVSWETLPTVGLPEDASVYLCDIEQDPLDHDRFIVYIWSRGIYIYE